MAIQTRFKKRSTANIEYHREDAEDKDRPKLLIYLTG